MGKSNTKLAEECKVIQTVRNKESIGLKEIQDTLDSSKMKWFELIIRMSKQNYQKETELK